MAGNEQHGRVCRVACRAVAQRDAASRQRGRGVGVGAWHGDCNQLSRRILRSNSPIAPLRDARELLRRAGVGDGVGGRVRRREARWEQMGRGRLRRNASGAHASVRRGHAPCRLSGPGRLSIHMEPAIGIDSKRLKAEVSAPKAKAARKSPQTSCKKGPKATARVKPLPMSPSPEEAPPSTPADDAASRPATPRC